MPMLSDIAGITGKYLEGTQASYNQARKDALRAQLLRAVDEDMVGAQKYLNPDFQERTSQQGAADILATAGPMFSAPQATGAIGYQGQAQAQGAPLFSMAPPAPELAQYDGMVRPTPKAPEPVPLMSSLQKTMAPLSDSLPALDPRIVANLAGKDAGKGVQGMLLGTPGAQGGSVGGSNRTTGVDDKVAARLQNEYDSRSKELSQLDRQDYLDKARLSLMKRKAAQYIDQTKGLGGDDEWQAEVSRLEKSITDRDEQRMKTLQKMNETDQKLLASRSKAESQNASLQLKREVKDDMAKARIAAGQAKNANDRMKIYQKSVQDAMSNRLRLLTITENARVNGLIPDMMTGSTARKAYESAALQSAIQKNLNEVPAMMAHVFAQKEEDQEAAMRAYEDYIDGSLPSFEPTPQNIDQNFKNGFFGTATADDKKNLEIARAPEAKYKEFLKKLGNPNIPKTTDYMPLFSGGSERSYATASGTMPVQDAPAPVADKPKKTPKLGYGQKSGSGSKEDPYVDPTSKPPKGSYVILRGGKPMLVTK